MIDLRSDTVTKPDDGMRRAMYEAEVGDDVFGEDPTVIELQQEVARLLGKEAALFVPSGMMGNQIALRLSAEPGSEIITEASSHIFNYESGAPAALSGLQVRTLRGDRGHLLPGQVADAIRPDYYWEPQTALVALENTHNKAGGTVYPLETMLAVCDVARDYRLRLHLDGARLWNASARSGISEDTYAAPFDTVSTCLSKGLGAPVGSVLAGTSSDMTRARRYRKLLGGGMRQVGVLAAAGLYAVKNNRARLTEDHENAQRLAAGLAAFSQVQLDPQDVQTNIVMFDVADGTAHRLLDELKAVGVMMVPFGPSTIRATTHKDVSAADIDLAIERTAKCLRAL